MGEGKSKITLEDEDTIYRLFERVDALLREGNFKECDDLLSAVEVREVSTDVIVAWASITYAARVMLPSRNGFLKKSREVLNLRGEETRTLLAGLEQICAE